MHRPFCLGAAVLAAHGRTLCLIDCSYPYFFQKSMTIPTEGSRPWAAAALTARSSTSASVASAAMLKCQKNDLNSGKVEKKF